MSFQKVDENLSQVGAQFPLIAKLEADELESGWNIIQITAGEEQWRHSIFYRPRKPEAEVLYLFPTFNWTAYNFWGGQSLYTKNRTTRVSMLRPCPAADPFLEPTIENFPLLYHAANVDKQVIDFFDENKIKYDVTTEEELHRPGSWFHDTPLLVIGNHSEYWTKEMYENVERYLDAGGSIMVLSGNTAFWRINYDEKRRTIEVDKDDHGNHWLQQDIKKTGVLGTHTNLHAMHTYAPYKVLEPGNWLLKGTGLKDGDLFGEESAGHDPTVGYGSFGDKINFILGKRKVGAASGLEYDIVTEQTPSNWVTIAKGINPQNFGRGQVYPDEEIDWRGDGGADLGYYRHSGGGYVFNAGSITFPTAIQNDVVIQKILKNFINRVTAQTHLEGEENGN